MNTHEGYSKKKLSNDSVLLAGGGEKSLADFLGGIRISSSKIQYKAADSAAAWTDLITLVNTDENVKQTPKIDNTNRPLMMINGGTSTGELTNTSMFSTGIYANASTKTITSSGYVKTNSNDTYVLLGGGGHKLISDFAMANAYLPLAGGTMTGAAPIDFTVNKIALNFRPDNSSYYSKVQYMTAGNEALVFSNKNAVTSFIFKCGYDLANGSNWNTVFTSGTVSSPNVPTIQLKNQSLYVNTFINSGTTPAYNFYVTGTSYFTGQITSSLATGTSPFNVTSTTLNANLNADLLDGYHNTSFEGYYKTTIDASTLDANTWYPVVMSIGTALQTRIRIEGRTSTTGAWNTRSDKLMALMLDYTVQGSSWGWVSPFRTIYLSTHGAGATGSPNIGNIGQLTNSSTEYVYVRGGAKYDFYLSRPIVPVIKTETYTVSSQSVAPTTTKPTAPSRNNALTSDNVASATKLQTARTLTIGNTSKSFDGSADVSWSLSEIGAAATGHNHTLSIATDSGTSLISLAANTKYKLTAGGSTYIFTTPKDNNTWTANSSTAAGYVAVPVATSVWMADADKAPAWRTVSGGSTTLAWNTESTIATIGTVTIKVKLPANPNTDNDTKVTQSNTDTSNWRPVTLGYTSAAKSAAGLYATVTNQVYVTNVLQYLPSTGTLSTKILESTVATGTKPINVTSTTLVTNLNSDRLDDEHKYQIKSLLHGSDMIYNMFPLLVSECNVFNNNTTVVNAPDNNAPFGKVWKCTGNASYYGDWFYFMPGETIYIESWVMRQSGATGNAGTFYVGIDFRDKTGKPINSNSGCVYFSGMNGWTCPTDGAWHHQTATYTIPKTHTVYNGSDGGAFVRGQIRILLNYNSGTIPTFFGGVRIRRSYVSSGKGYLYGDEITSVASLSATIANDKLPLRLLQYITSELTTPANGFGRMASSSPFKHLHTSNDDCMLVTTAYSNIWSAQIALDYRSHNLAVRNNNNGTWNSDWAYMMPVVLTSSGLTNCNSVNTTGIYTHSGFTNRPSAVSNWGTLFNMRLYKDNNNYHRQLFFDCYSTDEIWTRSNNNGTWTDWKKICSSANSSVSLSGSTLTVKIAGTEKSLTNTWRGILNNLTSTSTTDSLSAAQGKALNDKFGNYLPLAGGTMTGAIKRYYSAASNDPMLALTSNNQDVWLWRINHGGSALTSTSGVYGFGLKYIGTGDGNNNKLVLYSDNQASTLIAAMTMYLDGVIALNNSLILIGNTSEKMGYSDNIHPRICFRNSDASQNVDFIFTDYDSYRSTAGVKLVGNLGGEWFEAPNIYQNGTKVSVEGHTHDGRYMRTFGTVSSGNLFNVNVDPGYEGTITYDPVATNMATVAESNPNVTALNLGNNFARRKQLLFAYNNNNIYYRRRTDSTWSTAVKLIHTGNISPSLDISGNTIRVTAGGVSSSYITVPYASSANRLTIYTEASDNTNTYRVIGQLTLNTGWSNKGLVLAVASRHSGVGIYTIHYGAEISNGYYANNGSSSTDTYYTFNNVYCKIRYFGDTTDTNNTKIICHVKPAAGDKPTSAVFTFFLHSNDYSDPRISILLDWGSPFTLITNGATMSSVNTSTYGELKESTVMNESNSCTGNAATASKWLTTRTLTLTGSVTGSASIDGSGDISLATTTHHDHGPLLYINGTSDNLPRICWHIPNVTWGNISMAADGKFSLRSGNTASGNIGTLYAYIPWSYITDKPSSFTPSSHTHPFSQITDGTCTSTASGWSHVLNNSYGGSVKAQLYMCHGSAYGVHLRGYTTSASIYLLLVYNNSGDVFSIYGDKHINVSGHIYLTGAVSNSSTSNTSQIVFGTTNSNHVVISSNTKAIIINPSTSSTTGQTIIGVDTVESTFGSNVKAPNFYTTSDRSKKQNITVFSEHIRKFQLKNTEKYAYGVIAQEVDEMFRSGEEGNMTVNYNSVLSFYIGQLENKVKMLEERIRILESK